MSNLDDLCSWSHAEVLYDEDVLYTLEDTLPEGKSVGDVKIAKGTVRKEAYTEENQQLNMTKISDIEFYRESSNSFVGIASTAINLRDNTAVKIGGLTTTTSFLQGRYNIGVSSSKLILTQGIGTDGVTGIVTFVNVAGDLDNIQSNDVFKIGIGASTEQLKVLNVDKTSSRLRVLRLLNVGSTAPVGYSHTASETLTEIPRQFTINTGVTTTFTSRRNKEIFFNPQESIGLDPRAGVGIGTTISFSNPGAGISSVFVPPNSIFLPNHQLRTGDRVIYKINSIGNNERSPLVKFFEAAPTVNTFLGVGVTLFVARQSVDFIGLTTTQVGVGSTGQFVGVGVTLFDLVHFIDAGVGDNHSLKTQLPNIVKGELEKNLVSVVGSGTHGLQTNDIITIDVKSGITTTVTIKYNKDNRKAVYNPLDFVAAGVVTSGVAVTTTNRIPSTIEIKDHNLTTGQKVIHTSDAPALGLVNNKEYYVYVVNSDKLKLVENEYEVTQSLPKFVGITSRGDGTLSPVNPPLKFYKNSANNF